MTPDVKTSIAGMIYNLNNENRAEADKQLKKAIALKVKDLYSKEYNKVKSSFSKENV